MLKSLGFGLSAEEKYRRAFEKGVLLHDWAEAARQFQDAARAFEKEGNGQGRVRALANAHLYEFLAQRQTALLEPLIALLGQLETIECIGSATETLPAAQLATELQAFLEEMRINALGDGADHAVKAEAHERARDRFAAIRSARLAIYPYLGSARFADTAESRYHLHAAWASFHRAMVRRAADPAAAAEEMGRAMVSFRLAGHTENEQESARLLADLRLSRTCWVCGREMQGQDYHFEYVPSIVRPYHMGVLERAHQDLSTLQLDKSRVAVCVVCKGLIMSQARLMADRMVAERVAPLEAQVQELTSTVQRLTKIAHHH